MRPCDRPPHPWESLPAGDQQVEPPRGLFSLISMSWRRPPLTTFETIVDLMGHTMTGTGLTVWTEWNQDPYPTGLGITPAQLRTFNLVAGSFQAQWNYMIAPQHDSVNNG